MADREQREKLIRFYKGTEGEDTIIHLVEAAEQAMRNHKYRVTGFLNQFEQEMAETVVANFDGLQVDFAGGYQGAERARAIFSHKDFQGQVQAEISALKARWNPQYARPGHRDVLGSIMGQGIERDRIGDIVMAPDSAVIITDKRMLAFLRENLTQIGVLHIQCEEADLASIEPKEERVKEIRATVASLRVDSIAAAGFGSSRSRIGADIAADKLKLNWQNVKGASQGVKEGDVISLRGRGRLEVAEVRGLTKKGRIGVVLKRFI